MTALEGVVALAGDAVAAFADACWDFLMCAAGLDKWLAPVGLPRRTEHFWKWRFKMSLRENVSLHRTHMYGRSPVSIHALAYLDVWRAETPTSQHVSLQMFRVEIGLGAVGAGEFSIRVFLRNAMVFRGAINTVGHNLGTTWSTGQDASSSLRSDHMCSCWVTAHISSHAWHLFSTRPPLLTIVWLTVGRSQVVEAWARRCGSEGLRVVLTRWLLSLVAWVRWLLLLRRLLGLVVG